MELNRLPMDNLATEIAFPLYESIITAETLNEDMNKKANLQFMKYKGKGIIKNDEESASNLASNT